MLVADRGAKRWLAKSDRYLQRLAAWQQGHMQDWPSSAMDFERAK